MICEVYIPALLSCCAKDLSAVAVYKLNKNNFYFK